MLFLSTDAWSAYLARGIYFIILTFCRKSIFYNPRRRNTKRIKSPRNQAIAWFFVCQGELASPCFPVSLDLLSLSGT